ncbi:MAG TPA: 2-hydroxyacyl-CoA dehydratase family protein [Spirochaetota bacterium]|nr:2-hydroxyacyl-CoA dehydratase family protein [Spirochaetota bacterium]HQQ49747.1 2-hydroxyacyl-CoA dehydratase family protein [Spirochaetota bacterium]
MDIIKSFENLNPYEYVASIKKATGKSVLAYMCSYTPEEVIYAAGIHPFRIFGMVDAIAKADAYLQVYSCSLVRGALEDALSGKLSFVDGAVFPHTCDSIQRLSDVWRLNAGMKHHFDVVWAVKLNTDSAKKYMYDVLAKFVKELQDAFGITITNEKLEKAISTYNEIRSLLKTIWQLKSDNKSTLNGSQMNALIKAAMVWDRDELAGMLKNLIPSIELSPKNEKAKRIMLIGGICNHPDIYTYIEDSGGVVVWDDLCTGSRYFEGQIATDSNPLQAIANRYYERNICPAKHRDLNTRVETITSMIREHNVQGAIFLYLKFCDPHSFDYPYIKEALDTMGIPSTLLELELQLPSEGQMKTRLEAFIDMI